MIEKAIQLGFYTSQDDMLTVLNRLVDMLDGSNDFTTKDEEDACNAYLDSLDDQG
jgi:hypothetical protein